MNHRVPNNEDWERIDSLFDAFQMLAKGGQLSVELWRRFQCMRCRELWEYITDPRSLKAVETSERYLNEAASLEELHQSFVNAADAADDAWNKVQALRICDSSGAVLWPISQSVDEAWIRYCVATNAKTCAEIADKEVLFTTIPDTDVRAWRDARTETLDRCATDGIDDNQLRMLVFQRWQEIEYEEEQRLITKLRKLVELAE